MIQKIADVGRRVQSMTKFSRPLLLSLLMSLPAAGPLAAAADTAARAARPKSPPDTHQSLSAKLLDFIGIPADSGALRGADDPFEAGEVWVVEVAGGKSRQLTRTAEFRSPIFLPGGIDVLALRGSDVVRLSGPADAPRKLATVNAASKLLGCSVRDPDKLLLLATPPGGDELSVLSISTGQLSRVPFDPTSREDAELMAYLNGWGRTYPAGSLYVQRHAQETLAGVVEWQDVFFQSGNGKAMNVSRCDATNCGQPSLSPDARRVVFIKGDHR
jgi:hypothetical protein